MISKKIWPFLLLIYPLFLKGVTQPVHISRICIDQNSNDVSVYFSQATDACGSFVRYELWGRENNLLPFQLLTSSSVLATNAISYTLPNRKNWEFKIYCLYACNGTDTLFSNNSYIDYTPPAQLEPDSVSVDLLTQQLQIGWPKAPESDILDYSLFKVNNTGNNVFLYSQKQSPFLFTKTDFDPTVSNNRVSIAVKDSCNNEGLVSNFHSPVFLSVNLAASTNYICDKKLTINWTPYVGWNTDFAEIWVKEDASNTWQKISTVAGNITAFTYTLPFLNRTYSFFIRSHKLTSNVTSTSNLVSFYAPSYINPNKLEIGHVSVIAANKIEITANWENNPLIYKEVLLQKRLLGGSTWNTLQVYPIANTPVTHIDVLVNTDKQVFEYRLLLKNTCSLSQDSSAIHHNILLNRSVLQLQWNAYSTTWPNQNSAIENKPNASFTWNSVPISTNGFVLTDTNNALCYRIKYYKMVSGNKVDSALSNVLCVELKDTTLIPGGFTPGGLNPIFKIVNPNIKLGEATMYIYNRWGNKVWEGDAITGWDGTNQNQAIVQGVYAYLIVVRRKIKIECFKGTITLIQ